MNEPLPTSASAPATTNRLAREASPYLRQHAHNPVDWYPWGPEALERAAREDKPILLSVGYSACHWCHVMERESFDDPAIAAKMNASFVCIKVDREERPDLDQIYQLTVQLLGRSGGWPLTVFLGPDRAPFFGGTYFPPVDRFGMPGFGKLLDAIAEAYRDRREDLADQAKELTAAIDKITRKTKDTVPTIPRDAIARAAKRLGSRFDDEHGGFGERPKFPNTMPLEVLLRYGTEANDTKSELRVGIALAAMREGGLYDHLAGGFHRYSTDAAWRVPHFEKMLYDNALLLRLYTDAARALASEDHEGTARDVARWVLAEMTHPEGGFFATQDADSEGEEGKFFVFSQDDVRAAIPEPARAELVMAHFGITKEGNFEGTDKTVLSVQKASSRIAIESSRSPSEVAAELEAGKAALLRAREGRARPFRDEKILAGWNGLMISSLAEAGGAFRERAFVDAAERALAYVRRTLVTESGDAPLHVARHALDGKVVGSGFLDDYAYLANAAIDLYEATGTPSHLELAHALVRAIVARFHDPEVGLVFTEAGQHDVLVRAKDSHDSAMPSGMAMACRALLRLATFVDPELLVLAETELGRHAEEALENPFGFGQTLCELSRLVAGSVDVVVVGPKDDPRTVALADAALSFYVPNRCLARVDPSDARSVAVARALAEGKPAGAEPVAYVCRDRSCSAPVVSPEALRALLARSS